MRSREDVVAFLKKPGVTDYYELLDYIYGPANIPSPGFAPPLNQASAKPTYRLGASSIKRLDGVKTELVDIVHRAIELSSQDFTVFEGLRTPARQKQLVSQGYSKTQKSKHMVQADGFGHAIDLVPWVKGHPVWDWDGCAAIAFAVDQAATQLGCADNIRWGGAWDRTLADFGGRLDLYMAEVEAYKKRHAGSDFIDGPHFEWVS